MVGARTGRDIQLFGALFLVVGFVDLLIIEFFPSYALKLFGAVVSGPFAYLVKLHSPLVHFLIGYGFLFFRPWSWGLAMAYGAFGIASEWLNQAVFGFHLVRSGFMLTTFGFLAYLVWRRMLFADAVSAGRPLGPPASELHS